MFRVIQSSCIKYPDAKKNKFAGKESSWSHQNGRAKYRYEGLILTKFDFFEIFDSLSLNGQILSGLL